MIESYEDWITCKDPDDILDLVGKKPLRRQRLFGCACCRRIWHLLTDPVGRSAVEFAEAFADGLVTREQKAKLDAQVGTVLDAFGDEYTAECAAIHAAYCTLTETTEMPHGAAISAAEAVHIAANGDYSTAMAAMEHELAAQCEILRDIFSLPFARLHFHEAWRMWNGGRPKQLAERIYQERNFEQMTELGDVLQRAGCTIVEILNHCRQEKPHVRGCWVLDMVLRKP